MALGADAVAESLKSKTGWAISACFAAYQTAGLIKEYRQNEGTEAYRFTYVKKVAAIIASNALQYVGASAGYGYGAALGAAIGVYAGINAFVVACTAGLIGSLIAGYSV